MDSHTCILKYLSINVDTAMEDTNIRIVCKNYGDGPKGTPISTFGWRVLGFVVGRFSEYIGGQGAHDHSIDSTSPGA